MFHRAIVIFFFFLILFSLFNFIFNIKKTKQIQVTRLPHKNIADVSPLQNVRPMRNNSSIQKN